MPHSFLVVNPFDVLLRLHQTGHSINHDFSYWIRAYRDPPIRTVDALIDKCPRVDWLVWFFEHAARLEYINPQLVLNIGFAVRQHLDKIANGRNYTKVRGTESPHAEGLAVFRDVLQKEHFFEP